jgi:16S rRNA (guanine966-N2)-methyltransferase
MWRSRVLDIVDAPGLRPTPERVRETLFNWLTPRIIGARCLDLYAGSGALGFEALSRGARSVDFVERNARVARTLSDNAALLGAESAAIHAVDAVDFLASAAVPYDVIFLDPPFSDGNLDELCRLIAERGLVSPGGKVYLERASDRGLPALPESWQVLKEKQAGRVCYALVGPGT